MGISRHAAILSLFALAACSSPPASTGTTAEAPAETSEPVSAEPASPEPASPEPASSECETDADCRLTTLSHETCCDRCEEDALSSRAHADLRRHCAEQAHDDCPSLDCPYEPAHAACRNTRCVRVPDDE